MNRENILYMKQIMMSAESLDMERFMWGENACKSIQELHSCGNTACFAGYMALSEKFRKEGGQFDCDGEPLMFDSSHSEPDVYRGADAVAEWLGISSELAYMIVYNDSLFFEETIGKEFHQVESHHLVKIMDMILNGELK